jgi:hypothetical protein
VNSTLTNLDLSDTNMQCDGAQHVAHSLQSNSSLQVHMHSNCCNQSLISPVYLQVLNLSRNRLSTRAMMKVADMLHHNNSLTEMDIGHNHFDSEVALCLGSALVNNKSLTKLSMQGGERLTRMRAEGSIAFSKGMELSNTLTR